MAAPSTLTDGMVLLRPYQPGDAPALYEAARESQREVEPWMQWCHADYTLADGLAWIESVPAKWALGTDYHFAITDAQTGNFMGGCSLYEVHAIDNFGAIAYWVRTGQTKKGLATRSARLVARFGLRELGLNRVELVIAVNNSASLRVADKLGAKCEGILRKRLVVGDQACDAVMFSLLLEDV